jgi:hypothetical protein
MTRTAIIANAAFAIAILIAYTVLTALNHDATPLITILVGQGAAVGIGQGAKAAAPPGDR